MPFFEKLKDKIFVVNVLLLPAIFFMICLAVIAAGPEGPLFFRYERVAVQNGEWWRLLTSHFTHSTWNHFFLNMMGLLIITFMFSEVATWRRWLSLVVFSSTTIFKLGFEAPIFIAANIPAAPPPIIAIFISFSIE